MINERKQKQRPRTILCSRKAAVKGRKSVGAKQGSGGRRSARKCQGTDF